MAESRYEGFVPGAHVIESTGGGGFRFAGMSHRGSIIALPSGIHAWGVTRFEDLDEQTLELLLAQPEGDIALLLLGCGPSLRPIPKYLKARLKVAGIGSDPMATNAAVTTYNILLSEKRRVAAALIAV